MVFNSIIMSMGGGTGSGGGSTSGITSLNGETGPNVTIIGDASIDVTVPSTNNIQISASGFVSGVQTIILDDLGGRIDSSGQFCLSNTAVSGQVLLGIIASSGQKTLNIIAVSGQKLLGVIASSGQEILSNVVRTIGAQGGADMNGDVDFSSPSGFIIIGDTAGNSPMIFNVDVHALSGLWDLGNIGGGGGNITSVGVLGGADLAGDIDFTDPSGFIVWGDAAGSSPIYASIDTHALSGLWGLNQININKLAIEASGQYIWNELNVSGQILLSDITASGQLFIPYTDFDWNGFFNRTDSSLDFDHTTQTFTISPTVTSYQYYVEGVKYTRNGDSVVIPSATEGVNVIYYDGATLTNVTNPNAGQVDAVIRNKALVSIIYWGTVQQSGIYVGEERHGKSMSPVHHSYHHFNDGLRYTPPGLALSNITVNGDGDLDTSAVFGVDSGGVSDEDIYHLIGTVGSGVGLPIYYMTGSIPNWNKHIEPGFSVRTFDGTPSTRLAYNEFTGGAWQLAEVPNRDYVLYHVFATTEKDNPMITIMGQSSYVNVVAAREGAQSEVLSLITNDLLIPETRPIATVIFQTSNVYDNQVKGRIISTDDGDSYIDWRSETVSRFAVSTSDHNALANLQGGAANERYHMTFNEYSTFTRKYYQAFASMTSGTVTHNLGTNFVNYNVYTSGSMVEEVIPDQFRVIDENSASLVFNKAETGYVVVAG